MPGRPLFRPGINLPNLWYFLVVFRDNLDESIMNCYFLLILNSFEQISCMFGPTSNIAGKVFMRLVRQEHIGFGCTYLD